MNECSIMNHEITEIALMCSDNNVFITLTLFLSRTVHTKGEVRLFLSHTVLHTEHTYRVSHGTYNMDERGGLGFMRVCCAK